MTTSPPTESRNLGQTMAAMVRLSLPVATVQLGLMLTGVVDTMFVGRVSAEALAAVALGNVYFFVVAIFGQGIIMALDPIVAQALGANDRLAATRGIQRGLVLALVMSVVSGLLLLPAAPVLRLLREPPGLVRLASQYAIISIAGIAPFYLFTVFRQTLQAMHRVAPIVWAIVISNVVNAGLNWALVFGNAGFPAMGSAGSAWATAVSRWVLCATVAVTTWPLLREYLVPFRADAVALGPLRRMFAIGWPIGVQYSLEFGVFGCVGVLMGWFGTDQMAGHQIALNIASFTFMVPLGVSGAAAVLVGGAIGRGDQAEARRAALAALICGAGFMAVSSALMLAAPHAFARLYTDEGAVIAVAAALVPLAGLFQVFDGIQVVSIGILRGAADTQAPMVINLLGFWLVGVPISLWLGFRTALGPPGLWWGLVIGLAAVAAFLLWRVRSQMARRIEPVMIDAV